MVCAVFGFPDFHGLFGFELEGRRLAAGSRSDSSLCWPGCVCISPGPVNIFRIVLLTQWFSSGWLCSTEGSWMQSGLPQLGRGCCVIQGIEAVLFLHPWLPNTEKCPLDNSTAGSRGAPL